MVLDKHPYKPSKRATGQQTDFAPAQIGINFVFGLVTLPKKPAESSTTDNCRKNDTLFRRALLRHKLKFQPLTVLRIVDFHIPSMIKNSPKNRQEGKSNRSHRSKDKESGVKRHHICQTSEVGNLPGMTAFINKSDQ